MGINLNRVLQASTCLTGFGLFLYGVLNLPQPTKTIINAQQTPDQIAQAYNSTVVNSREFAMMMGGIGCFLVGIGCICVCRGGEPKEILPV